MLNASTSATGMQFEHFFDLQTAIVIFLSVVLCLFVVVLFLYCLNAENQYYQTRFSKIKLYILKVKM